MKQSVSKGPTLQLCPFPSLLSLSRASHEIPSVTVVSEEGEQDLAGCLPALLPMAAGGRESCLPNN